MTKTAEPPAGTHSCCGQPASTSAPEGAIFDVPDRARLRSVQGVCDLLGLSKDAVYGLIHDGSLTASRVAGKYRVSIPDLEAYVRSTRVTPAQNTEKAPAEGCTPPPGPERNNR